MNSCTVLCIPIYANEYYKNLKYKRKKKLCEVVSYVISIIVTHENSISYVGSIVLFPIFPHIVNIKTKE